MVGEVAQMKDHRIEPQQIRNDMKEQTLEPARKKFQSVTRLFLASEESKSIFCPHCGALLNFSIEIEWMGPDAFLCNSCHKLLHMSLIHRALRDLGVK
jgi:hypothetical protein